MGHMQSVEGLRAKKLRFPGTEWILPQDCSLENLPEFLKCLTDWICQPPQEMQDTQFQSPGQGRSRGRGHGNSLQYSCLENPMDRGAWWPIVLGVAKSWTQLKRLSMHTHTGQFLDRSTHTHTHTHTHTGSVSLEYPDWYRIKSNIWDANT